MKTLLTTTTALFCFIGLAYAHGGHQNKISDLKTAPTSHQIMEVEYCKGVYHLKFKDGSTFDYPEYNLRLKTDSGPNGPNSGTPVQVSAGMQGGRANLVFSDPQEISSTIKRKC